MSPSVRSTVTRPRRTELSIVMAMYNEDDSALTRSMQGVMKNLSYLCKHDRSKTLGEDGWKKVVVHIVGNSRRGGHMRVSGGHRG